MARIATSPLRSTPIVTPRSPSALAKSKPYKLAGSPHDSPLQRQNEVHQIRLLQAESPEPKSHLRFLEFPARFREAEFPRAASTAQQPASDFLSMLRPAHIVKSQDRNCYALRPTTVEPTIAAQLRQHVTPRGIAGNLRSMSRHRQFAYTR